MYGYIRPIQGSVNSCSPRFVRPSRFIKPFTNVFRSCTPKRRLQSNALMIPLPPRLLLVVSQTARSTTFYRRNFHERKQFIHTALTNDSEEQNASSQIHELSLQLSQRPMNGNALMQYTLYNKNGVAAHVGELPKLGIAERYGLGTRDLRVFDLPSGGFPHFLVREHTILIHLFDLRLLVQDDQALLFHIVEKSNTASDSDSDSDPGLDNYHEKGYGSTENNNTQWPRESSTAGKSHSVARVFSHNLEGKIHDGHGLPGLPVSRQPYELCVLEAALASVTSVLEAEYLHTQRQVSDTIQMGAPGTLDLEESRTHTQLRIILDLTRKLASIAHRARQVRNAVQEVLNEDEDMANMYLTDKKAGKPHKLQDHQDVEYLFEAYFKASDAVVQEAASLMENVRRTEETIHSTLSVRRNQIMVLEAKIEILMLALSWAMLVAGWYGMNVVNYFEEHTHAFAVIVSLSFTAIASASWYGMRKLRHIHKLRL